MAAAGIAPIGHAEPIRSGNAPLGSCAVTDLSSQASACLGYVSGNDDASQLAALVGSSSWSGLSLSGLTQYKDDNVAAGSTNTLFDVQQNSADASKGTLKFLMAVGSPFVVTVKGGNEWAAYYYASGISNGSTLSFDIPGQQGAGLSHASVYVAAGGYTLPAKTVTLPAGISRPVPEPATLWLVWVALGGVGFAAQRRSCQSPA
jgi:hypothetical protein